MNNIPTYPILYKIKIVPGSYNSQTSHDVLIIIQTFIQGFQLSHIPSQYWSLNHIY